MRRLLALIIAITGTALIGPVLAQPGPGGGGAMEPGSGMAPGMSRKGMGRSGVEVMLMRHYDPQTVTTVKGGVESLGTIPPGSQVKGAIRNALLKTEEGNITVYLGPGWYLDQQKISLKAGDQLEVTGSKITLGEKPCVIAKDLKVNGKTFTLRDDKGVPVWRGQRPPGAPAK